MAHTPLFQMFTRVLQKARSQAHTTDCSTASASSPLKRRRFLKLTALAGGTTFASTILPRSLQAWNDSSPAIAIIGGGLAGLNAAYHLKKVGLTATVYEAKPRVGGRIQSIVGAISPGLVNDLGGCFINSDHADMLALAEEFGVRLFNRADDAAQSSFPKTAYWLDGKARSEAEIAENLYPLAQQIAQDVALLDEDFDQHAPRLDQLSVTDYLNLHTDKIPQPFIRTLIELTIRTEYGVEPEESSALQLLFNLPTVDGNEAEPISSDEVFLVEGGSSNIIDRLAQELSGQIQTNKRLTELAAQETGFRLTFADRSVITADYVIVAIPFPVLRQVQLRVELPETLKRFIHEVNLGSNEKMLAGFRTKVWQQDNGFIGEAWSDFGFCAAWEDTQRQTDQVEGVLTFFLGGEEVISSLTGRADWHGKQFVERTNTIIPGLKDAAGDRFLRTNWTQDPLVRGGYTTFKPGQYTEFSECLYIESDDPDEEQTVHVGNLVFAGEHLSDEFYGFMNGAAQTGRLAADVIVRRIYASS
ncbi:FAD-dependent oxidoreductase [Oscillatoria sp. FACHB-1407]|uniref:flavin monoamine oxidase family protein n=1 Tax=Oscillatoria sp. FACHB-1407 TaxID=2692847 RepID=UPI001688BBE3|nr:NAD(P)/FAD-dependent oxidoreductase [Oscillatoria sp. FACHB-1407]MBD2465854.1 FAD-dependent oxidoreductase [Oscillatoria sp. FACHB-1407]